MAEAKKRLNELFFKYLEIFGLIATGMFLGWLLFGNPAHANDFTKEDSMDYSGSLYEHGPKLKKWIVSELAVDDWEAQDLPASEILWRDDDSRVWHVEPWMKMINVPYKEFREIAFMLPEFNELPILWAGWCRLDRPVEFLVRCIEDEDVLLIDTSGFHNARYRAACRLRDSLV